MTDAMSNDPSNDTSDTVSDASTDAAAADGEGRNVLAALEMDMDTLTDLAAPQPSYLAAIELGGVGCPMEGVTVTFSRELTDHVLRHHELFSSVGGLDL